MAALRVVRELLLLSLCENTIDGIEFLQLYELNKSRKPDFPYWQYAIFNLDELYEPECLAKFRFYKNDIYIYIYIYLF